MDQNENVIDIQAVESVAVPDGTVAGLIGKLDQLTIMGKLLEKLSDMKPAINLKEVLADDHAMDKAVAEADALRKFVIKLTRGGDPVTKKGSDWIDYEGVPFLWSPGANRIVETLRITVIYNGEPTVSTYFDKKGEAQNRAVSQAVAYHPDFGISMAMGIRTTEKAFFQQNEQANIAMSAMESAKRRVIAAMFGLTNLTWAYVTACNPSITVGSATKVEHVAGSKGGSKSSTWKDTRTPDMAEDIRLMLLEMKGGDVKEAGIALHKLTTFTITEGDDKGKTVEGKDDIKQLTEKQIFRLHPEVSKYYKKQYGADFKRRVADERNE